MKNPHELDEGLNTRTEFWWERLESDEQWRITHTELEDEEETCTKFVVYWQNNSARQSGSYKNGQAQTLL